MSKPWISDSGELRWYLASTGGTSVEPGTPSPCRIFSVSASSSMAQLIASRTRGSSSAGFPVVVLGASNSSIASGVGS